MWERDRNRMRVTGSHRTAFEWRRSLPPGIPPTYSMYAVQCPGLYYGRQMRSKVQKT